MRAWAIRNIDSIALVIGAILINVALDFGAGVTFGWWGFSFWAGVGLLIAVVRKRP